jgi:hypothetical protein
MRALFVMPLICALMSLLAIFGLAAMTIVPRSGAESFRGHMIFTVHFVSPNKSPEPTADGAVSSAIAVHAASRRWLSFFR